MKTTSILIVDDHHLMLEGYKSILSFENFLGFVEITTARNCEEGYNAIMSPRLKFDMVFVDLGLPSFTEQNLQSGSDLAKLVKKYLPNAKLLILTSHVEALLIYEIIQKVDPDGLLIKSDFTADDLMFALKKIVSGETYHSPSVTQLLKSLTNRPGYLDNYNRQIIFLLSQGIKTKNMPEHLPLSLSSIDKRKSQIKDYFAIDKGNDEDIIREARNAGYI